MILSKQDIRAKLSSLLRGSAKALPLGHCQHAENAQIVHRWVKQSQTPSIMTRFGLRAKPVLKRAAVRKAAPSFPI